jgi:predicted GNAT family acetyltransferase
LPYSVIPHAGPDEFLKRAEPWLLDREAEDGLLLGFASERRARGESEVDALFATVEMHGDVVGCILRTPPHKLLVTAMPTGAAGAVAEIVSDRYDEIPAVLGRSDVAEAVASSWAALKGVAVRPGMRQCIYRLDEVVHPSGVPGRLRVAEPDDIDLVLEWTRGFADDVGHQFALRSEATVTLVEAGAMFLWDDGAPVSMAVARGRTPNSIRVGYVYTPRELRGRGYASATVAEVSQRMLDSGLRFCVLYTDLSNQTSNAIYQRIGYQVVQEVSDFDIVPRASS